MGASRGKCQRLQARGSGEPHAWKALTYYVGVFCAGVLVSAVLVVVVSRRKYLDPELDSRRVPLPESKRRPKYPSRCLLVSGTLIRVDMPRDARKKTRHHWPLGPHNCGHVLALLSRTAFRARSSMSSQDCEVYICISLAQCIELTVGPRRT